MPFTSSYKQEFTNIPYVSNAGYESTLTTFHHGPDSPFTNIVNQVKCDKNLVVSPPTVVTAINVTNFTYHYENIASLTISWVPPEYINGHDVVYSLWVGLKSLPLDASFPSGSTLNNEIRYSKNIHVSEICISNGFNWIICGQIINQLVFLVGSINYARISIISWASGERWLLHAGLTLSQVVNVVIVYGFLLYRDYQIP